MVADKKGSFLVRDMVYIAVGAVFIAVCSWIAFPGPIPFTLQTFGVFFVLGLLGGRRGFLAVTVYCLMGVLGAPVFSGFVGGAGVFLGPTGGYILGFGAAALVFWLMGKFSADRTWATALAMGVGLVVCYVFGTVWYAFVFAGAGAGGFASALTLCVVPYIIPDVLKTGAAVILSRGAKKRLGKLLK
ncbi:MAG: biotin transporter BioY [Clostridia bacterium]|nr:biotin transporter BioY [Clostridia bacterium]